MSLGGFLSRATVEELAALIDRRISTALRDLREQRRWLTVPEAAVSVARSSAAVCR